MAPGGMRKLKVNGYKTKKTVPNNAAKHASMESVTVKGVKRVKAHFHQANAAFDAGKSNSLNETQSSSPEGSERGITNQTLGNDHMPQSPEVPSTQSIEVPSTQSTEIDSATKETGSKKRGRGQTMGKGLMKAFVASGNKMKINVDPLIGRPINGLESAKLSSQIGVLARDVLPVPKKWTDIDEENDLDPVFDHMNMHMDINIDDSDVRDCLIDRLKNSSRQKRYKLHMHYKKFATLEEAKKNKPSFCPDKQNWETMCEYFATSKFNHTSTVNGENRKKVKAPHISGRTPFTIRRNEISQKDLNGDPCDRIELYKRTHFSEKKGWSSKAAEENWNLMKELEEKYNEEGIEKTSDEIVLEVLGHGSSYIKGLGYGPKPPSRRKTSNLASQRFQKELQETQQKLQMSESQVTDLKTQVTEFETEVTGLKDKLSEQGENINKLMEFMKAKGMNF